MAVLQGKEKEIMDFLHEHVFDPVLQSRDASAETKAGVRLTIIRMEPLKAAKMMQYFWSAIKGTDRSIGFAERLKREGFDRFEEALENFRVRFDDRFLRRP